MPRNSCSASTKIVYLAVYMEAMQCAIVKLSAACRGKTAPCEKHVIELWDNSTVVTLPSGEAADLGSAVYAVVSVAAACE